jgi:hypothetical protein
VTEKLERAAGPGPRRWWQRHPFSVAVVVWGGISMITGLCLQFQAGNAITTLPEPRIMLPALAIGVGLGLTALVRREREYLLVVSGISLTAASVVMGWFVLFAAILLIAVVLAKVVAELL